MTTMNGKIVLGLTEQVKIFDIRGSKTKECLARIDTGATKSSIDASLASDLGLATIYSKFFKSAHGRKMRPIVVAEIEIAGKKMKEEFSVADRSHMKYPVLIGQNILKDFIIDPSK